MKHKLLSVVALAGAMFASTSAFAQWAEPTPPELNEVNAASVESGHSYYIKNVGAGQFITGGNSWSTQISLTTGGLFAEKSPALVIYVADSVGASTNLRGVTGVSLRLNGTFTVTGASGDRTFTNTYLFRDGSADAGFIDHGTQDMGYIWKITKADNGYYRIQTADGDPAYPNAAEEYAGWYSADGPLEIDEETGELIDPALPTAVTFNVAEDDDMYSIDWMFIPVDEFVAQKDAYQARLKLYEKYLEVMEEAELYDLDVDVSTAEAIYNNQAATSEDMEAAMADLTYQLNQAKFLSEFEGASPEEPVEVTDVCLVNPAFEEGNINGWKCTFVSGVNATNVGFQGAAYSNHDHTDRPMFTGEEYDDDGNPSYVNKFIEAWRSNGDPWKIGDAELSQTVYGLPAGMYKLTCDAIAVQQWGHFDNPVTGVKIFIATDAGTGSEQEIATNNERPEHFSVTFVCPEGVKGLTFGLKTEDATANWIAADNFRIYYYGKTEKSPEQFDLADVISRAEASEISGDDQANKEILDEFVKALEEAQDVVEKNVPAEEYVAAKDKLLTALTAAQQSIKDYVELQGIIEEAEAFKSEVLEAGFDAAADAIDDMIASWEDAYEERTATKEMIDTLAGLTTKAVYDNFGTIKEGTTLTFLLDNPGFTRGAASWSTAKDCVPGWTLNSGTIGKLRRSTHNIETWHATFDFSQTIPNLPAGVYDITLQGFVRHDDDSSTDQTWLYGGISKASLIDLDNDVTQKRTEPIYDDSKPDLGDTNRDNSRGISTDEEGNTLYQCNGMTGAYYWFQEINPNTEELYYTNHVKVLHEKDGDLTIGIHCESTTDWVIWDNFAIKYIGQDNSLIAEQLEQIVEQFVTLTTEDEPFLTAKAVEMAEKLPAEAQKVIDSDDADAMLEKIKEISAAIDYVKEGFSLKPQLAQTVADYYALLIDADVMGELVPTDNTYEDLLAKWDIDAGGDGDPSELADNDAVRALIQSIKDGWVSYVMSGATDATKDNPIEVTAAIYNPTYIDPITMSNNANGWTSTIGTPGFDDAGYAEVEFYDKNFNHFQTIKGLTPGYYVVAVDGFYRAGFPDAAAAAYVADTMANNAIMYALGVDSVGIKLQHIFAGAAEEEGLIAYNNEVSVTLDSLEEEGVMVPVKYWVPNRMESAILYLETGMYVNEIGIQVGEDGVLTIGINKDEHISGDWTIFTNWTLTYYGTEGLPDGVESIAAGSDFTKIATESIYNLAGQKVSKAKKGIYIINGRKVVVK